MKTVSGDFIILVQVKRVNDHMCDLLTQLRIVCEEFHHTICRVWIDRIECVCQGIDKRMIAAYHRESQCGQEIRNRSTPPFTKVADGQGGADHDLSIGIAEHLGEMRKDVIGLFTQRAEGHCGCRTNRILRVVEQFDERRDGIPSRLAVRGQCTGGLLTDRGSPIVQAFANRFAQPQPRAEGHGGPTTQQFASTGCRLRAGSVGHWSASHDAGGPHCRK